MDGYRSFDERTGKKRKNNVMSYFSLLLEKKRKEAFIITSMRIDMKMNDFINQ